MNILLFSLVLVENLKKYFETFILNCVVLYIYYVINIFVQIYAVYKLFFHWIEFTVCCAIVVRSVPPCSTVH